MRFIGLLLTVFVTGACMWLGVVACETGSWLRGAIIIGCPLVWLWRWRNTLYPV